MLVRPYQSWAQFYGVFAHEACEELALGRSFLLAGTFRDGRMFLARYSRPIVQYHVLVTCDGTTPGFLRLPQLQWGLAGLAPKYGAMFVILGASLRCI